MKPTRPRLLGGAGFWASGLLGLPKGPKTHKPRSPEAQKPIRSPDAKMPRNPEAKKTRSPEAQQPSRSPEAQMPRSPKAQKPRSSSTKHETIYLSNFYAIVIMNFFQAFALSFKVLRQAEIVKKINQGLLQGFRAKQSWKSSLE